MNWTLNSIRIYVQEFGGDKENIIAKLQPLNSGSVLQKFGYGDLVVTLTATVVGTTDMNAILALAESALSYTLDSPFGTSGDYFVKNVKYKHLKSACQTMRPDLAEDAPVYSADMELWIDG
jgi:hypothetical protein